VIVLCNILSDDRMSLVYDCCWSSPAQSFSGRSPAELMTTFYCLRFETPPTWRARSPYFFPPGIGWPGYIPRHWIPFSSPPTTRRVPVELFDPTSTREFGSQPSSCLMATVSISLGEKRMWGWSSPSSGTKIKNVWSYTSAPTYIFQARCLNINAIFFTWETFRTETVKEDYGNGMVAIHWFVT
jgi:hypothetical protein